jgi:hypothetical protein
MTPEPNRRSSPSTPHGVTDDATATAHEAANPRKDDTDVPAGAAAKSRRLGPFEYTLFALIALGIAITVVMAILNPS